VVDCLVRTPFANSRKIGGRRGREKVSKRGAKGQDENKVETQKGFDASLIMLKVGRKGEGKL